MYVLLGFKVKNMKMEFNNRATWRWAMNKQGEDLLFFLIWLIHLAAIENSIIDYYNNKIINEFISIESIAQHDAKCQQY